MAYSGVEDWFIGVFFVLMIWGVGMLIAFLMFLSFLQKFFESIRPENRRMVPGQVWMIMIPGFGMFYWQFQVVNKLGESIRAEMTSKGIAGGDPAPGASLGRTMCGISCASVVPYVGIIAAFIWTGFFIAYWVKMARIKNDLTRGAGFQGDQDIIDNL